jgi:hypothetical protein
MDAKVAWPAQGQILFTERQAHPRREKAISMEGLATWWPLEFDNISLRVCDIDRGSFAFGAVTGASQSGFHTIGFKTTANTGLVKGIDSETEVIQIPPFLPRRGTSSAPEFAIYGHKIKK